MGVRVTNGRALLAAVMGLGVAVSAQAGEYPDIGPLPALKVDAAKAELGKRLFFDKRLSGDAGIACSTCHAPENGFGSKEALSPGYPGNGNFRNAPSVINTAYKKVWLHDGRIGTDLNDVTREMITEDYIMNMDMRIMQERLKQDPVYVEMFKAAGKNEPSNGGARSMIPEYLKSLTSRNAPFDSGKLSASAKSGMALFKDKAGCIQCHNGPLLSDQKPHNTGVPENLDVFLDPMNHQAFVAFTMFQGIPNYMALKRDPGYLNITLDPKDMGKFITPSLRELKYTAPYMHNGTLNTLAEVVEFYNQGGGKDRNKSPLLKPLQLSKAEKKDLVAFLEALSGDQLTSDQYVWKGEYPAEYPAIDNWTQVRN
ncbi:cytochrome-c peroxidase [Sedimenticola hydrogenitrophicus]|uniref:cytochrome-c peroxidase n=1 Tax=Sedimenticola hydrogenitrophicus TaxID=2967975 RepID=UPI002FFA1626